MFGVSVQGSVVLRWNYLPIFIVIIFLPTSLLLGYTPLLFPVIYISVSFVTFLAYAQDKHAAQKGNWRVSENTLHTLSLLCGWPGAIIAQQRLRHKTKKTSFRVFFWVTVLVNSGGLVWLHTSTGTAYLHLYASKTEGLILNEIGSSNIGNSLITLLRFHAYL